MRYQRIFSQIWHDEEFILLSEDAQKLFLYIMSSPHSNMIGLYVLPQMYILGDLNWDMKRLAKPFGELLLEPFDKPFTKPLSKPLIDYDETVHLVLILNHLRHNPIHNTNQVKAAIKVVNTLPDSRLFEQLKQQVKRLAKPFLKPLLEQLGKRFSKRLGERYSKPETETEEETEEEEDKKKYIKKISDLENKKKERDKIFDEKILPVYPFRDGKKVNIPPARQHFVENIASEDVEDVVKAVKNLSNMKAREKPNSTSFVGVKDLVRFFTSGAGKNKYEPWREYVTDEVTKPEVTEKREEIDWYAGIPDNVRDGFIIGGRPK